MQKYIYDLETYKNFFLATFKVANEDIWYEFEISDRINEIDKIKSFLDTKPLSVGYNNINFDYPVLHNTILKIDKKWTSQEIYEEVQNIINSEYSAIKDSDIKIPQLDLFKVWHYDNKARITSLKWLEFAMRMKNIEDLPYVPGTILTSEQMDEVKSYCRNDILATEMFYNSSKDNIQLRVNMTKELNHNVMNYSDVKIGEYLNRVTYEKLSGKPFKTFKDLQTNRSIIQIKDLIPDFIKFKTKPLQDFLEQIKTESFNANTKGDWEKSLNIGTMDINFAKGGLHSKDKAGIKECKEGYYLKEKDVGSMYPKALIAGNMYPEHLGPAWNKGIELLYNERANKLKPALKKLEYKSKEYDFINSKQEVYKLAMNGGGYGKTGSDFGWQKDKLVMFKVTFRGQLSLLMLLESYYLLGDVDLVSANTDGIVIHYKKEIDYKVQEIHDEWEKITDSILEDTFYSKIVFRDVNNYIAFIIDKNGNHLKYKMKGAYEIDRDYHKNHSKRVVAIAASNYFINNIEPHITLKEHLKGNDYNFAKNYGIYDFCIGSKMKGKNVLYERKIKGVKVIDTKLGKVNRYYVSKEGSQLIKILPPLEKAYKTATDKFKEKSPNQMDIFDVIEDNILVKPKDRETNIEAGWKCTLFNKFEKKDDYGISYNYYINEVNKLINF